MLLLLVSPCLQENMLRILQCKVILDLVAHDCGYPLSRYTCRATRVALHPLKILVSHLPPPVPGGVAPKFRSEKVSRYTGAQEPNRNRKPEPSEPFFPKPKAEPEPPEPPPRNRNWNRNRPFLLNCAEIQKRKNPFCRGTAETENRNRLNRSISKP